ncbi:NAD(P)-binding protein [Dentipellis sp. KUC8613]|nr:NAD(P)-binding protein [Dentipellis sp. KUC8613]
MSFVADLFSAAGRVAVITGGGSGLGFWMSEAWVKNGGKVYITGRREETLKAAVAKLNSISKDSAFYFQGDVSVQAGIDKLVKEISAREDAIDVLVNNAGTYKPDTTAPGALLPAFDSSNWSHLFTLHAWAPAALTSAFAPLLAKAAKKGEGRGSVILIGSAGASLWFTSWPANGYSVTKAAEAALTKTLANKLVGHGVRVNTIVPGVFPTEINDASSPEAKASADALRQGIPMKRDGGADDISAIFLFLATKASAYVTGQEILVDGGWTLVANGRSDANA